MRRCLIVIGLLICAAAVFGTESRVNTMGGKTGMLPDDDTNIGLFPQRINDFYIARFQSMSVDAAADFLVVVGEKGSRMGFIGGTAMEDNFLNLIYGLSSTSAIKLGLRYATGSDKTESGTAPNKSTEETSSSDMGIDLVYGTDNGDMELAIGGAYSSGPFFKHANPPWGTRESSYGTASKSKSEALVSQYSVGLLLRKPQELLCFDHMVAGINLNMASGTGEDSQTSGSTTTKNAEREGSQMEIDAGVLAFKNKQVTDQALLVFGMGFGINYLSGKSEDKLAKLDTTVTKMIIAGPEMRLGLETDITKWLQFRFGATHLINLFSSREEEISQTVGQTKAKSTHTISGLFKNGQYSFASGLGLTFGKLNIDLQLSKEFWTTGPQMLFNSTWGQLGLRADAVYHFGTK